ncbi:MFS transporter [Flavobacterium sp. 14A]|uniref:MFS transporter n=1 Tax=Flavobacterium sp. 14A TaxID=2735896 RepID=UPI00156EADCB|nr:MFS transporter [Flavobacterium sp. 14A]NRT12915.1 MFS family permease [Flavobacterium sp. 14A]
MRTNIKSAPRNPYILAWAFGLLFYLLEYAVRSAPSVMIPELSTAFATSPKRVTSVIGMYYLTYSVTSLIAGIALDKLGAKYPLSIGTIIAGLGCILFAVASIYDGYIGRLLQGAGSAMAFPACVYLAARAFSPRKLATAIGVTQCLGMLGGSAGQFLIGPALRDGYSLHFIWIGLGALIILIGVFILFVTPKDEIKPLKHSEDKSSWLDPYKIVFTNKQSYLSGAISGLLFAPTTIFAMTWGVAFFQKDRNMDFESATLASAFVALGWVVGCPLMGWIADKIGRRKPVLIVGASLMIINLLQLLYLPTLYPAYISTFLLGVASGAAMIPYSVIKESNPDNVKGSATGAINFLTFGVTSLLGPLFSYLYGNTLLTAVDRETHFQSAGLFWVVCIGMAIVFALLLRETGKKASEVAAI